MENTLIMQPVKVANLISNYKDLIKKRAGGTERSYRSLWVTVNFAVVRDQYIRTIGARAFGVFMVIRAFTGKDKKSYPSLNSIAFLSGCSITTIRKEINILIKNGWLEKSINKRGGNGRFENSIYTILETDLIRGTRQKGFMQQPLLKSAIGGDKR